MNKLLYIAICVLISIIVLPRQTLAVTAKQKTITGIVSRIVDTQIIITSGSANTYYVQTAKAHLTRKYGSPMTLLDILPGDKLEVKGIVGSSNVIPATEVRSLVLYTHNGTVTGKVISTNIPGFSFVVEDTQLAKHTVYMDTGTIVKKNSTAAVLHDIEVGMKATVRGAWERTNANIAAKEILLTQRLIAIEVTGILSLRSPDSLTVIGNQGTLYGVDITKAKITDKKGKAIPYANLTMGGKVRVVGKHVSGKQQIIANSVKDGTQ